MLVAHSPLWVDDYGLSTSYMSRLLYHTVVDNTCSLTWDQNNAHLEAGGIMTALIHMVFLLHCYWHPTFLVVDWYETFWMLSVRALQPKWNNVWLIWGLYTENCLVSLHKVWDIAASVVYICTLLIAWWLMLAGQTKW